MIPLTPIESSNLTAIGYDPAQRVLAVSFKSGTVYHYTDVPPEAYANFLGAESKGRFFAQHVKGQFEFTKVDTDAQEPR